MSQSFHPLVRDPKELWQETSRRVTDKERIRDMVSDSCRCHTPVEGPTYLKRVRCKRCQRTIRG